ncbi:MAG: hypothetical protein D6714_11950, partial [Bacteroidetes bacterium]
IDCLDPDCNANALCPDNDGDGISDEIDLDDDNDGIPDLVEGTGDTDQDGIPDAFDLDSDNDGIFDVLEAGHGQADANQDGVIDGPNAAFGANGLFDNVETTPDSGVLIYVLTQSDADGSPDFQDTDADGDGCGDAREAGFDDPDENGLLGADPVSVDANGVVTSAANGYTQPTQTTPGFFDFQDPNTLLACDNPVIGLAKNVTGVTNLGDGSYRVECELIVENFGNVPLQNLEIFDDIIGQFSGMNPVGFQATDGTLVANPSWDGQGNSNVLFGGQMLPVGASGTVHIAFTVTPGTTLSTNNSAVAGGSSPLGTFVADTSTSGTDPDGSDNDHNPDENDPTPLNFTESPAI